MKEYGDVVVPRSVDSNAAMKVINEKARQGWRVITVHTLTGRDGATESTVYTMERGDK